MPLSNAGLLNSSRDSGKDEIKSGRPLIVTIPEKIDRILETAVED